jgi:zinc protease
MPASPVSTWKLPANSSDYMKANLPTMETRTLANGVMLIVKKNPANRVFTIKTVFRGASSMTTPEKAGIEAMTLALIARGTAHYPYAEMKRLQYERSSALGYNAASYDWASFDLNTIDKYWDEMFAVYSDCLLAPAFDPAQFSLVKNDFKVSLQKSMADPYNYAVTKLHSSMFAGHPYVADFTGTVSSIESITLDDIKAYYIDSMTADRMVIVAVGNFDADKLAAALNTTIGTIARKGLVVPEVAPYQPRQALYLEKFDKSKGVAYVRGDYPIANARNPDFASLQLAYSMLDELLFSIVRTEHGAAYSVWSRAFGFKSAYGSLVVYKTDKPSEAKGWVDEAIAVLASGKTLNLKGGADKYAPIASTIEAYKAKYINAFFSNQQTNAETAAQLASSSVYFGDHLEYLRFIDKINAIHPDDIVAVLKAYVLDAPITWIVVSDQATLSKVDKTRFDHFTGVIE